MRSRLIHSMAAMRAIGEGIHKELATCDDVKVAPLMNALREIEEFRQLCADTLRHTRGMNDEFSERTLPDLIAEADRIINIARLALNADSPRGNSPATAPQSYSSDV